MPIWTLAPMSNNSKSFMPQIVYGSIKANSKHQSICEKHNIYLQSDTMMSQLLKSVKKGQ